MRIDPPKWIFTAKIKMDKPVTVNCGNCNKNGKNKKGTIKVSVPKKENQPGQEQEESKVNVEQKIPELKQ
jgi:hypothetical protein